VARIRGPFVGRRLPSFKGGVYVREQRGRLYVCKWPRARGRPTHPTTIEQNELFWQANWATKYIDGRVQDAYRRLSEGTGLYPRDLLVASMYGRGFTTVIPGQARLYPVSGRQDLSDTLDLFSPNAGAILTRDGEIWQAIYPTAPGQVLISQADGEPPKYQAIGSEDGLWTQLAYHVVPVTLGLNVYFDVTVPAGWKEIDATIASQFSTIANRLVIRLNGDAGNRYVQTQHGMINSLAITKTYIFNKNGIFGQDYWQPADTTPKRINIRFNQNNTFTVAQGTTDYTAADVAQCHGSWKYTPAVATEVNKISFASEIGQGLAAGTKIIVRAQM